MALIWTFSNMEDVFSVDYFACFCLKLSQGFTDRLPDHSNLSCLENPGYEFFFGFWNEWMVALHKLFRILSESSTYKTILYRPYDQYRIDHMIWRNGNWYGKIGITNSLVYRGLRQRIKLHKVNWKQQRNGTGFSNQMHNPTVHQLLLSQGFSP